MASIELARSALECGSSSYRFSGHDPYGNGAWAATKKAVAAATALQSGLRPAGISFEVKICISLKETECNPSPPKREAQGDGVGRNFRSLLARHACPALRSGQTLKIGSTTCLICRALYRTTYWFAHPAVAAVSDRRRRSEIDATIYAAPYKSVPGAPNRCGDEPVFFR